MTDYKQGLASLARDYLSAYINYFFPTFEMKQFHEDIIHALMQVERGNIKRLMINMPPRHGKSIIASEHFPAWYLGRNPDKQIICASYGDDLARGFGRKVRNQLQDASYQYVFPGVTVREDSKSAGRFHTPQGGVYYAVGVGGAITGRGADLLLIDDPIKNPEDADSEVFREKQKEWFSTVAYTRLMPGAAVVIIQTRWHEDDLSGWLIANAVEPWTVIKFPALSDSGQALWPEWYPASQLELTRQMEGPRRFSALYQQNPIPAEGAIFPPERWQYYETRPDKMFRIVQSWDTGFKKGQDNDYSVCTVWGETLTGLYLMHMHRARSEFPELLTMAKALYNQYLPHSVLVEDKASGQSLIQTLQRETRIPVMPVKVDTDKVARAHAAAPAVAAGRVFLPKNAPWLADFLAETSSFPHGKYDDIVDSMTQYISWAMQTPIFNKDDLWAGGRRVTAKLDRRAI